VLGSGTAAMWLAMGNGVSTAPTPLPPPPPAVIVDVPYVNRHQ